MIELQNLCVKYSYKEVLKNVSCTFEDGKIYALLGENGAGKSTLAHILCGDKQPDSGNILINNQVVKFENPKQAIRKKILCVHQRPLIAEKISIFENLSVGSTLTFKELKNQVPELLKIWLPEINMNTKVEKLAASQKFFVSLISILLKNPEVIILDEPTALLDNQQKTILFENIKKLAGAGKTIILITHDFDEALENSDKVILLKNGVIAANNDSALFTKENISSELFGGTFEKDFISENIKNSVLIKAENLVQLDEMENLTAKFVSKNRKNKIAYVPSDRVYRASNPNLSILQIATAYKTNLKSSELKNEGKKCLTKAEVNIKLEEKASALSGGMLQKIIITRELETEPKLLILCEPFQGLDYAACNNLLKLLGYQGQKGTKILIICRTAFPENLCAKVINGTKQILQLELNKLGA